MDRIGGHEIKIVKSGVGQRRVRTAITFAATEFSPDYVMILGFCGGTRDDLSVGDLIVADKLIHNGRELKIENGYVSGVVDTLRNARLRFCIGPLATFNSLVLSRRRVAKGTVAVDMESFAIGDVAIRYGVPVVVVKAVSDVVPKRVSVVTVLSFLFYLRANSKEARHQLSRFAGEYFSQE